MTAGAAVEIEARAEAVGHDFLLEEIFLAGLEELVLVLRESGDGIARAR